MCFWLRRKAFSQAEEQPALRRLNLQPLAPGRHVADLAAGQRGPKVLHQHVQASGLQHLDPADGPADQLLPHITGKDDDFR